MIDVLASLRTFLLSKTSVTALLSHTKAVFVTHVPTGTPRAYVVIHGLGGPDYYHLGGLTQIRNPLVQVECWAETGPAAVALADAVRAEVSGYRGRMDTLVVKGAFIRDRRGPMATDAQDASQAPLYSVQNDVEIWHDAA